MKPPKFTKIVKNASKIIVKNMCFFENSKNRSGAAWGSKMVPKIVQTWSQNGVKIEKADFVKIVLSLTREHDFQGSEPPKMRPKMIKKQVRKRTAKKKGSESDF